MLVYVYIQFMFLVNCSSYASTYAYMLLSYCEYTLEGMATLEAFSCFYFTTNMSSNLFHM